MSTKIYIELSSDIKQLLNDTDMTLEDILKEEGIETEVLPGVVPYQQEEGVKTKDVVSIILAGAVAIPAIILAITHFLTKWHQKPYFVEYEELEPIKNNDGTVLLDNDGHPCMKIVKKHELIQPDAIENEMDFEINLTDMVFRFKSKDK